ncbi:hypothetical protein L484_001316 [Morus notabilis]|uniref:Uncharacterized protein n=1 Tax=Morus notabilis TaxID=981085 RepID=W9SMQ0_9ROSA|nr:hypothetical protein L484_001316 [Morus notabilis]
MKDKPPVVDDFINDEDDETLEEYVEEEVIESEDDDDINGDGDNQQYSTTCAGSSEGAQPPPGPHRVPAFYESASEPRQRRARGGAKVGIHTRDICEPVHDVWKDISDMDKRTIQNRMLDWFNMDYNYKNGILRSVINREAAKCYKDWKSSLHRHFKRYGRESLPSNMRNQLHWDRCCDRFSGDKFQKISETNKTNRSNQKYPSLHGQVSYSQHRNKKNTLNEERQTHRTQSTSSSTRPAFDEHGVLEQVLGMRRGHKIRVDPTLSQKYYSRASPSSAGSYSDATSSAQPDPRVSRYLKKSCQKQVKIYKNKVKVLELVAKLQPNIQLSTTSSRTS